MLDMIAPACADLSAWKQNLPCRAIDSVCRTPCLSISCTLCGIEGNSDHGCILPGWGTCRLHQRHPAFHQGISSRMAMISLLARCMGVLTSAKSYGWLHGLPSSASSRALLWTMCSTSLQVREPVTCTSSASTTRLTLASGKAAPRTGCLRSHGQHWPTHTVRSTDRRPGPFSLFTARAPLRQPLTMPAQHRSSST